MRTVEDYRTELKNRYLDARSIHELILSDEFELAYGTAKADKLTELERIIETLDRERLKTWIAFNTPRILDEWTAKEVKRYARRIGIYNWSRKDKWTLLAEIQDYEQRTDPTIVTSLRNACVVPGSRRT